MYILPLYKMRDITSFMVFFTQIPRVGGVQAGMPVISQRVKVQKNPATTTLW